MPRIQTLTAIGLLLPQLAWASDYSGLVLLYVAVVVVLGGVAAGFEWMLVNAFMDRGDQAGADDPESQNKSRFGCGLGTVLWIANSVAVHLFLMYLWS